MLRRSVAASISGTVGRRMVSNADSLDIFNYCILWCIVLSRTDLWRRGQVKCRIGGLLFILGLRCAQLNQEVLLDLMNMMVGRPTGQIQRFLNMH